MCKYDTPLDSSGSLLVRCLCLVFLKPGYNRILALMVVLGSNLRTCMYVCMYRWNRTGFYYYGGRGSADILQLDLPETFGKRVFSPERNSAPNRVNVQPQYAAHVAEFMPFPRCQENSARTQPYLFGGFLIVPGTVRRRHRATSTENF